MPISPIPIDYSLIASLGSSYNDQRLKAQKMQEMEQERVVKALQMQQLAFKLDEEKRARQFQTGLEPYVQQQTAALQQQRAGMQEPQPTMLPEQTITPSTPFPSGAGAEGMAPIAGEQIAQQIGQGAIGQPGPYTPPRLEPSYQPPDPAAMLKHDIGMADTEPNQWKMRSEYAFKNGRIEEGVKFSKMALTGEFKKLDMKIRAAQESGDSNMVASLLDQRKNLEMEAINQENKMGEYLITKEKTVQEAGKMKQVGLVTINGMKVPYLTDPYGRGYVEDPSTGQRHRYTPTGPIEPMEAAKPGASPDAQRIAEWMSQGMTRQEALDKLRYQKNYDQAYLAQMKYPDLAPIPNMPPTWQQRRRPAGDLPTNVPGAKEAGVRGGGNVPRSIGEDGTNIYYQGKLVPQEYLDANPPEVLAANYAANKGAKTRLIMFSDLNDQAVSQASANRDQVIETSRRYNRFNIPAPNRVGNWLTYNAGSAEQQKQYGQFQIALLAFAREYMKIVTNSARTPTELSVQAQQMVDRLFRESDSWAALEGKLEQAQKEMDNTTESYSKTIKRIDERMIREAGIDGFGKKVKLDPDIADTLRRREYIHEGEQALGRPDSPPPPQEKFKMAGSNSLTDPLTGDMWDLIDGYPVYMGKAKFGRGR